jgi:hypothetical protein
MATLSGRKLSGGKGQAPFAVATKALEEEHNCEPSVTLFLLP